MRAHTNTYTHTHTHTHTNTHTHTHMHAYTDSQDKKFTGGALQKKCLATHRAPGVGGAFSSARVRQPVADFCARGPVFVHRVEVLHDLWAGGFARTASYPQPLGLIISLAGSGSLFTLRGKQWSWRGRANVTSPPANLWYSSYFYINRTLCLFAKSLNPSWVAIENPREETEA